MQVINKRLFHIGVEQKLFLKFVLIIINVMIVAMKWFPID